MADLLKQALLQGLVRAVDYYFARHLQQIDGQDNEHLALLAALASSSVGAGDVCLDIADIAGQSLPGTKSDSKRLQIPALTTLQNALKSSDIVARPGESAPLILEGGNRLYLERYWRFERQVADALLARQSPVAMDGLDSQLLGESLRRMFPPRSTVTDWQQVAAVMAVLMPLTVVSGGPGTGKTHTVASILALLIEQAKQSELNIALVAPTGKAAARLTESIRQVKQSLACAEAIKSKIPEAAATIHRLIGMRPGTAEPRHHAGNPVGVDVLVVDEASMIDLPLMARLLQALPAQARIILLGDKDQLASVEAGSVFADITGERAGAEFSEACIERLRQYTGQDIQVTQTLQQPGFADSVVQLQESHRFDSAGGIGALANAVNAGDSRLAMELLEGPANDIAQLSTQDTDLEAYLDTRFIPAYSRCIGASSAQEAIESYNALRILCALRKTAYGVESINALVENSLQQQGLITTDALHYKGRPILITRNDYNLGLFNGDIGVLWPDSEADGQLKAWFIMPDNHIRQVLPVRLPQHETAYGMTIHKSQGSEFEHVLMVLPGEYNELLSRELLYTGITRARRSVDVWGTPEIIRQSIRARVRRVSGLSEKLYSAQ